MKSTIKLKGYSSEEHRFVETGEEVSTYMLAKSLTPETFTLILEDFVNSGARGWREGTKVGQHLHSTHPTLQRLVICHCLGIIAGLSETPWTDARNDLAIETARKITAMVKSGDLPVGSLV